MTWLLGVGLFLLVALGYWWLKRPVYYKNVPLTGVERFLSDLLQYFADGSILFVEHPGSPRFVQFVKYLDGKAHANLHFSFPEAEWSAPYFTKVAATLRAAAIPYTIRDTSEPLCPRFIDVDGIADPRLAFSVARAALSALGFSEADTFRIHFKGHHSPDAARGYAKTQIAKRRSGTGSA